MCLSPFGLYNKLSETRYLIKKRNLFFVVLEAGPLRSGYQHGEGPLLDHSLLVVASHGRRGQGSSLGPLL